MKIINMLPVLAFGDAVGNDTIAVHRSLLKAGYESVIVAAIIDTRLEKNLAQNADDLSFINAEDIVIYHLSTGHELNKRFAKLKCKKIVKYHNITPLQFFMGYQQNAMKNCMEGYKEAKQLARHPQYCFADSKYNKQELRMMGYGCPIEVLPILIPFDDYTKKPDENILSSMQDGYTNIVFMGRIVPNKRQEDIIAAFYYYKKYYNKKSRLILVGNYSGMEIYYESLQRYVNKLEISDVIFTGHVSFAAILAYYHSADLFLSMSDHEGFCVPLVEAMYFNIPIIAKDTTAISDTLGEAGILLEDQNPQIAAGVMNRVMTNKELQESLIVNGTERLKDFSHDKVEKQLLHTIEQILDKEKRG